MYGATPIEDIPYYNVIVRQLTEWTGTNQQNSVDQFSITDGIGGIAPGTGGQFDGSTVGTGARVDQNYVNVRQKFIHGIDLIENVNGLNAALTGTGLPIATGTRDLTYPSGHGMVPNSDNKGSSSFIPTTSAFDATVHPNVSGSNPVRRYQVQLALGIFNQEKLIPTKFMASQLAIEITLENPQACMYYQPSASFVVGTGGPPFTAVTALAGVGTPATTPPSYQVTNVNLIPEILEFDASYDESFLKGLQTGGVPIKFATWNNYRFSNNGVNSVNLQIQERSRSVKAIFCMQRRAPETFQTDSGAAFFNTSTGLADGNSTFQEYQYRIGGRYFPAQSVQNATSVGGNIPNGGAESYVELAKALNTLGDYRIATSIPNQKWAFNAMTTTATTGSTHTLLPEFDYDYSFVGWKWSGAPIAKKQTILPSQLDVINTSNRVFTNGSARCGDIPSSAFAIAIDLETSNGLEISGLNAEEQSDISLIARWSNTQAAGFVFDVFTYIDSMIVLRENNVTLLLMLGFRIDSVNCMIHLINGRLWFKPDF